VAIVDLDIVNPYLRTREAKDALNLKDIKVIAPEGKLFYADLPLRILHIALTRKALPAKITSKLIFLREKAVTYSQHFFLIIFSEKI